VEKLTKGFAIILDGVVHNVEIAALRPYLVLRIDGQIHEVKADSAGEDGRQAIEIDGRPIRFARAHAGGRQILRLGGRTFESSLIDPRDAAEAAGGEYDHVRAPMPGSIVEIHKRPGDEVLRGETLVTIESMKLQMALVAPRDGTLAGLMHDLGDTFDKDEIVVELAPLAPLKAAGE
jgi:acetyl/propionyl-CoA carboxylase alpha subunit